MSNKFWSNDYLEIAFLIITVFNVIIGNFPLAQTTLLAGIYLKLRNK